jgi:hypothetical protein
LVVVAPHLGDGDRHSLEIRKSPLLSGFLASLMRLVNSSPGKVDRDESRYSLDGPQHEESPIDPTHSAAAALS